MRGASDVGGRGGCTQSHLAAVRVSPRPARLVELGDTASVLSGIEPDRVASARAVPIRGEEQEPTTPEALDYVASGASSPAIVTAQLRTQCQPSALGYPRGREL